MSDTATEHTEQPSDPTSPDTVDTKPGNRRSASEIAARVAAATGWTVVAQGEMSLIATKTGFAPITVHCSSAEEAAEIMLRTLLDDDFQPLVATKAAPVPPRDAEPADADAAD